MRTMTSPERDYMSDGHPWHQLWVEVQNGSRTYKELTNLESLNWVESIEWGESIDQPDWTFTMNVRRNVNDSIDGAISAAPTWGASPLNRDDGAAYAPLLYPGRNIKIFTAVAPSGTTNFAPYKKIAFWGRIDEVDWHADPIVVTGRSIGGWVIDAQIREEVVYADGSGAGAFAAPVAVETVMAEVLGAWDVFDAPTLYTPSSPGWMLNNSAKRGTQGLKSVLDALQNDYALSIGWLCRYRFDASDNFKLTFYDPDRSDTTPDETFQPSEYRDITALKVNDADVRNYIVGSFYDDDGNRQTVLAEDTGSQAAYGLKSMILALAFDDLINTSGEMDTLVGAAIADLAEPLSDQEMETLYFWPVQLGDIYTFTPTNEHYDDDQDLAVVGYRHHAENGEIVTTMQCRGSVAGSYHQWFRHGKGNGDEGPRLRVSVVIDDDDATITWSGANVEVQIDGAAYAAPGASPWVIARDGAEHDYEFRSSLNGAEIHRSVHVPQGVPGFTGLTAEIYNYATDEVEFDWDVVRMPSGATFNTYGTSRGSFLTMSLGLPSITRLDIFHDTLHDLDASGTHPVTLKFYVEMILSGVVIARSDVVTVVINSIGAA